VVARHLTRLARLLPVLLSGTAAAAELDSVVELPLRLPLAPLFAAVERSVPVEMRRDRAWLDHDGYRVRYAARRGPLEMHMQGDTLLLRTTVGYWVEARKDVLGRIPLSGSCGIDEPPRGVVLTLASQFGIRPDWRLAARSTVLPPAFLNPCRMTFAEVDVTGTVARALYQGLWRTAEVEVDRAVPELTDIRNLAEAAWLRLQAPLALDEDTWLLLNPRTVWATQPVADGGELSLVIGLAARPRLASGPPPQVTVTPLPPLGLASPRAPVMRLPVRLAIAYQDANALLQSRLNGQHLAWAGKEVVVDQVRLVTGEQGLTVEAKVAGAIDATVHVAGNPAFDAESGEVYLRDLDYRLETGDTEVRRRDAAFHELLQAVIAERARWPLAERLASWRERGERALNQPLPPYFTLRTTLKGIEPTGVRLTDTAIVFEAEVEGVARLLVD